MNIIPTQIKDHHTVVTPIRAEDHVEMEKLPPTSKGLTYRYSVKNNPAHYNNLDAYWYPSNAGTKTKDVSLDDQEVIREYVQKAMAQKEKIVIVEIGVHRAALEETNSSTKVFLENKRPQDIYIGIDIEDKKQLQDHSKNIFTLQARYEDKATVLNFLKQHHIEKIDVFMIDGYHSINQVYTEWEYTELLSDTGIVLFHDTNGHPGPYFVLQSIDTDMYDVYKYFTDILDYGMGVAVRKKTS